MCMPKWLFWVAILLPCKVNSSAVSLGTQSVTTRPLLCLLVFHISCESESCSVMSDSLWPHRLYSPWNSPGENTGEGNLSILQGNLPNPGIKPRSPALQADSLPAELQGKPKNTGVGSLSLHQGIFLTQESNRSVLPLQAETLPTELSQMSWKWQYYPHVFKADFSNKETALNFDLNFLSSSFRRKAALLSLFYLLISVPLWTLKPNYRNEITGQF